MARSGRPWQSRGRSRRPHLIQNRKMYGEGEDWLTEKVGSGAHLVLGAVQSLQGFHGTQRQWSLNEWYAFSVICFNHEFATVHKSVPNFSAHLIK
jgi:hypothetical protein